MVHHQAVLCLGGPVKTILCLLENNFTENLLNLWVSYTLESMQMKSTTLSIVAIAYYQKNWVCPHVWSCHLPRGVLLVPALQSDKKCG